MSVPPRSTYCSRRPLLATKSGRVSDARRRATIVSNRERSPVASCLFVDQRDIDAHPANGVSD